MNFEKHLLIIWLSKWWKIKTPITKKSIFCILLHISDYLWKEIRYLFRDKYFSLFQVITVQQHFLIKLLESGMGHGPPMEQTRCLSEDTILTILMEWMVASINSVTREKMSLFSSSCIFYLYLTRWQSLN